MNQILVSFSPGTSGRFISTISYMLENNLDKEIKWTKDNSAHDINIDGNIVSLKKEIFLLNKKPWSIKYTHDYPDFNIIKNKMPNCKFIIIGFNIDNTSEIILNILLKNHGDSNNPLFKVSNMSVRPFTEIANFDTDPFIKELYIPEVYKEDILVIMYDEIYKEENNSFIALEKISRFLNKPINDYILSSYKKYVDGRNLLLKENKQHIDGRNQLLQKNNTAKI